MKNKITTLLITIITLLLSTSCGVNIEERKPTVHLENCGSITVNENLKTAAHYLDVSNTIKFAKATVSGTGIKAGSEPTVTDINVTDGKGSFTINNVPAGKNRIVTVQALDASKKEVFQITLRAVVDVEVRKTAIIENLTWATTALGNVFDFLHKKDIDITTIDKTLIEESIDNTVSSFLIDSEKIANDYISNTLKEINSYILQPSSLNITCSENASFTVQVCDPLSSVLSSNGTSGLVSNIAPGTWDVIFTDANNNKTTKSVRFTSGSQSSCDFTTESGSVITDKIILHVYDYVNCYIWDTGDTEVDAKHFAMEQEGSSSWYTITFNVTSAKLIFTKQVNSWTGQTGDLSRTSPGEYWYKNGTWSEYDPEDSVAPVLNSFTSNKTGTVNGIITFTVTASDDKALSKAVFTIDSNKVGEVSFSSLNNSLEFAFDTEILKNGSHEISVVVYDGANNPSEIKTLSFTTQNVNTPPTASITGTITAGLNSKVKYSAANSKDKNGTIASYLWNVTGAEIVEGTTTSKEIFVMSPSSIGSFNVSLTVTDDEGATDSTQITVNVIEKVSNDFREESIYFLMTARFYDGDSSNNRYCRADDTSGNIANNDPPWRGDFKGLIEKLDYIKALGFSAIWITPPVLNRSDYDFHGYHAWDMTQIDPRLESTGATYQDLINAAHAKGIKIIQDIVLNHSCRFGLKNFFVPKYYGDRDDPEWGKNSSINYYDEYNPNFEYNGLDVEPNSGKSWYNGDLWQKEKPTLAWNPDLSDWGVVKGTNNQGRKYYGCQWPDLRLFNPELFHPIWLGNWEDYTCQSGTIHEDCIDLNTESPVVQQYLIDAYTKYINMGVDAFRIDTVKHVSRVVFNRRFIPAFKEAGGENFYMFGEVCTRVNEVWNHGVAPLSTPFYTWKERSTFSADDSLAAKEGYDYEVEQGTNNQPTSNNHALIGNNYHTPDYSQSSGLSVIDFPMHWNFSQASAAYGKRGDDHYYNDATWNVVYVDSHDYGPNSDERYGGGTGNWAENMTYMWTFRGIPCLYYGSEIEFKAGMPTDKGAAAPLESTGRAYFGDNIEGSVEVSDFGEWTNATGTMKSTLESPLSKHLSHLNKIRRQVPALQKGQYSNEGCDGYMAFKRRFVDDTTDSFVLVTISGGATFSGLPGGTYVDCVTGDTQTISEGGTITASCSGQGNARIYVLTTAKTSAPGKITGNSGYLK